MYVLYFVAFLSWTPVFSTPQDRHRPEVTGVGLETRIFDLINAERKSMGLSPLKRETRLSEVARAHSRDMGRRNFFDHINPDGKAPGDRAREARYSCTKYQIDSIRTGLAENIYQNNLYSRVLFRGGSTSYDWNTAEEIAVSTVEGWMSSPGHRRNILDPSFDRTGIGVDIALNDKIFITQVFC
jgi:uncharacterized protein YkwD